MNHDKVALMAEKQSKAVKDFQDAVLSNYKHNGRVLPWRQTTDPYKIFISEMMLQQTQVDRVIEKYNAFLKRFPTAKELEQAPLADVLRLWQGLGYNRRAQYVHTASALFSQVRKPSYEQLHALKGVGPYTAAAVCAFAYNQDIAAVDVNIRRVFTRYFGEVDDAFITSAVPAGYSCDWHNALMDFGATLCTKKSPSCHVCPLKGSCHALANDIFHLEPTKSQKKFAGSVRWHRGQVLKLHLAGVDDVDAQWNALSEKHRSKEKFVLAREQLRAEGLINR